MTLEWIQATTAGEFAISGYEVSHKEAGGTWTTATVPSNSRGAALDGLKRSTAYVVRVTALTTWTRSESREVGVTTLAGPAGSATITSVSRNNATVAVSWVTQSELPLLETEVQWSSTSDFSAVVILSSTGTATSHQTPSAGHVRARVRNAVGWGPWSATVSHPAQLSVGFGSTAFSSQTNTRLSPSVSGGDGDRVFSMSGTLPPGVSFDSTTGTIVAPSDWMTDVLTLDVGGQHSCAVTESRTLYCWGANSSSQLGDGSTTSSSTPSANTRLTQVASVAAGASHTCAVTTAGDLYCWGANTAGQVGNGGTSTVTTPQKIAISGQTVKSVHAGSQHTCALTASDQVYCWGDNTYYQVGSNVALPRTPTLVPGLTGVTQLSVGDSHSCALTTGGTVHCWGRNSQGQLGLGSATSSPVGPQQVPGLSSVAQVAAGGGTACARTTGGALRCWGLNTSGQIGDNTTTTRSSPTLLTLTSVSNVEVGGAHTCAAVTSGALYCWGENGNGQLGVGSTPDKLTPTLVSAVVGAVAIGGGTYNTCTVSAAGALSCWGRNSSGQVGDGTLTTRTSPKAVPITPAGFPATVTVTVSDPTGSSTATVHLTYV
jgi:alpha-tubulin suppressor-like RCC1 family protein